MLIIFFTERERQLNAVIEDPFFMCACPAYLPFFLLFLLILTLFYLRLGGKQPVESNYIPKSIIFFLTQKRNQYKFVPPLHYVDGSKTAHIKI